MLKFCPRRVVFTQVVGGEEFARHTKYVRISPSKSALAFQLTFVLPKEITVLLFAGLVGCGMVGIELRIVI